MKKIASGPLEDCVFSHKDFENYFKRFSEKYPDHYEKKSIPVTGILETILWAK